MALVFSAAPPANANTLPVLEAKDPLINSDDFVDSDKSYSDVFDDAAAQQATFKSSENALNVNQNAKFSDKSIPYTLYDG